MDTTPFARRSASGHPEKQDQCIFFHYYKAKRRRRRSNRLLPLKLVAGGGPNQLPRHPDGDLEAPKALVTVDGPAGSHLSGPSQHEEVCTPYYRKVRIVSATSDSQSEGIRSCQHRIGLHS